MDGIENQGPTNNDKMVAEQPQIITPIKARKNLKFKCEQGKQNSFALTFADRRSGVKEQNRLIRNPKRVTVQVPNGEENKSTIYKQNVRTPKQKTIGQAYNRGVFQLLFLNKYFQSTENHEFTFSHSKKQTSTFYSTIAGENPKALKFIPYLKQSKATQLDVTFTNKINDEFIPQFNKILRSNRVWEDLRIQFTGDRSSITEVGFKQMCATIEKFQYLTSISLNCPSGHNQLNVDCVESLYSIGQQIALTEGRKLTGFGVNYSGGKTEIKGGYDALIQLLKVSESTLKSFSLGTRAPKNIIDIQNLGLIMEQLVKNQQLDTLRLNFGVNNLTKAQMEVITKGLAGLTHLQNLWLDFRYNKLDDEAAEMLSKVLGKMTRVTTLYLDLRGNYDIKDSGVETLSQDLSQLPGLKHLTLHLSFNEQSYSEQVLPQVTTALKQQKQLETCELSFRGCDTEFNSKSLKNIGDTIKDMHSLKILNLDLSVTHHRIDKSGLESLKDLLLEQQTLRLLKLDLSESKSNLSKEDASLFSDLPNVKACIKI